ncbi:MAG: amidohydrolase family protein [Syntrophales bacterium]|nr:amidohydrolase family protein [Syntrophales bacterium]
MNGKSSLERLIKTKHSRRRFLAFTGKSMALLAALPGLGLLRGTANAKPTAGKIPGRGVVTGTGGHDTLLRNGFIVDGSGKRGFKGHLLIRDDKIERISRDEIRASCPVVDCMGQVIMPGIIDAHSHMDWYLPIRGRDDLKLPFTAQGVTTFVAGQCGYGVAGFRKNSPHMNLIASRTKGLFRIEWDTMAQYFDYIEKTGLTHNLVNLAGHGTTRTSIRGFSAAPVNRHEMKEMLALLEQSLDEGAVGVSLGLQYEPGIFAQTAELREIARLVKRKGKILTVHLRAYSALAPGYPMSVPKILLDYIMPFDGYEPHNLIAIDEMLNIARETDVRLQISHLIFVGTRTFKTCEDALKRIDRAIRRGVDVKFDTYAYHCGQSVINVIFPAWFLAKVPQAYDDPKMLARLRDEWQQTMRFLGFGVKDIQITYANHPELNRFNGLFLADISKKRGMDWFENTMDFARKSKGLANILNHGYSNLPVVEALLASPAALFMTDALPAPQGVQNPAMFGNFPRFFQLAREKRLIPLEEAVRKMSGATAERYGIKDRGFLRKGLAADITVIDWNRIRDNNTLTETSQAPTGIAAVFINGRRVLNQGKVDGSIRAGRILPA